MAAVDSKAVSLSGIWSWFNDPRAVYDATSNTLFVADIMADGTVKVFSWDYTKRLYFAGQPRTTLLEVDDHANPALCVLDNGELLTAYSVHNGDSFSCRSANARDIRTWDSAIALASGANDDAYAHLVQMGDTATTVFWFYRRGAGNPRPIRYRTSTDRGDTWGGDTDLFSAAGRPYFKCVKTSGSRIDFVVSTGQPSEAVNSLYHGYITVASDGTLTFFKTDGTEVTSPPFAPDEFTLVYDGTTNDGWQWDLENFSGTPVIVYATFESSNEVHRYFQARWSGSAWQSDEVATGGTTATADYLYASEVNYSGGICLDPNDVNTVYLSREYGAGDFRLEKWVHTGSFPSGTWAKDSDVSGNTGTVNARPYCPRGLSPTVVLYWSGTYTSYTNYSTRLMLSPAPNWRAAKPTSPAWTSAYAPSGVQAYYLIREGSGAPQDLTGNGYHGTLVGTPTWNAGAGDDYGAFLSGLSTSNYVHLDALAAAIGVTSYPIWIAALFKTVSVGTTLEGITAFGRSSTNTPLVSVHVNDGAATTTGAYWRDDAGSSSLASAAVSGVNDGEFHVVMSYKAAANSNRVHLDGIQRASGTSTTSTITLDRGAIGVLRRNTIANAFAGEVHAVIVGWGAIPNPHSLAMDLLRGQFAGTFSPDGGVVPVLTRHYRQRRVG